MTPQGEGLRRDLATAAIDLLAAARRGDAAEDLLAMAFSWGVSPQGVAVSLALLGARMMDDVEDLGGWPDRDLQRAKESLLVNARHLRVAT